MELSNQPDKPKENLPPNLYTRLFTTSDNKKFRDSIEFDESMDDELFDSGNRKDQDDNFSILDLKFQKERENRLQEKDKMYKIQKHYFLKDSYKNLAKKELRILEKEIEREKEYLDNCFKAEEKLNNEQPLTAKDVNFLIKRNYPLFSKTDQKDINTLNIKYNVIDLLALFASGVFMAITRSTMIFFNYEMKSSRRISYLFVGIMTGFCYLTLKERRNINYVKNMKKFCEKNRDKILTYENEHLKTPYDKDEKRYIPEFSVEKIFKF